MMKATVLILPIILLFWTISYLFDSFVFQERYYNKLIYKSQKQDTVPEHLSIIYSKELSGYVVKDSSSFRQGYLWHNKYHSLESMPIDIAKPTVFIDSCSAIGAAIEYANRGHKKVSDL